MKLEKQVCSLELAKRLMELGVRQDSLWWWVKLNSEGYWRIQSGSNYIGQPMISAFTVAELGGMLAELKEEWIPHDGVKLPTYYICQVGKGNGWDVDSPYKTLVASDKEADARAKLLAFWVENIKLVGITVSWLT